jgi:hypothetical protein
LVTLRTRGKPEVLLVLRDQQLLELRASQVAEAVF